MKKFVILAVAALTLGLAGCETARERGAVSGGIIGAGTGAVIGSMATGGRSGGAYAGALLGGAAGAYLGAESAPRGGQGCYQDQYGRVLCPRPVVQQQYTERRVYYRPQPRCYRDSYGYRYCE